MSEILDKFAERCGKFSMAIGALDDKGVMIQFGFDTNNHRIFPLYVDYSDYKNPAKKMSEDIERHLNFIETEVNKHIEAILNSLKKWEEKHLLTDCAADDVQAIDVITSKNRRVRIWYSGNLKKD